VKRPPRLIAHSTSYSISFIFLVFFLLFLLLFTFFTDTGRNLNVSRGRSSYAVCELFQAGTRYRRPPWRVSYEERTGEPEKHRKLLRSQSAEQLLIVDITKPGLPPSQFGLGMG